MSRQSTLPEPWLSLAAALGGVGALAKACETTPTTVWRWAHDEFRPSSLVVRHVQALARRRGLAAPWD